MLRIVPMIEADFEELPPPVPAEALAAWAEAEAEALLAPTPENAATDPLDARTVDFSRVFGPGVTAGRSTLPEMRTPGSSTPYQRRRSRWSNRRNNRRTDTPREISVRYATRCAETGDPIDPGTIALWYPSTSQLYCTRSTMYQVWNRNRAAMGFQSETIGVDDAH